MKHCPLCRHEFSNEVDVCPVDGSRLDEETWQDYIAKSMQAETRGTASPIPVRAPITLPLQQTNLLPKPRALKPLVVVLGLGVAVALISILVWTVYRSWFSLEGRLSTAIARGNLVTPPGANAYELYQQLKLKSPPAETLKKYEDQLFPVLTAQPGRMLTDFAKVGTKDPSLSDWQQAEKMLSWASELRPDDKSTKARAAYAVGRIAYMQENKDEAIKSWAKSAELDPAWPLPFNSLGLVHNDKRKFNDARRYLAEAIRRDPNWAIPYNHIGSSYFYEKKYDNAIPYYKKAIELESRWARPHAWLATIAMNQAQYQVAIAEFEKVLDASAIGTEALNVNKIRDELARARVLLAGQQSGN